MNNASHQCDCEPACPSRLWCWAAPAADNEVGTAAGSEADTKVGTVACTGAEAEGGSEAVVWPHRGTGWRRRRRRWRSPGHCC